MELFTGLQNTVPKLAMSCTMEHTPSTAYGQICSRGFGREEEKSPLCDTKSEEFRYYLQFHYLYQLRVLQLDRQSLLYFFSLPWIIQCKYWIE